MHSADYLVIVLYLAAILAVGLYFLRRQSKPGEYFVGSRNLGAGHIALSVVATDVGGGFSIGLGGLGFSMGLSGSWLLFSGLLGAWAAAVFLIPPIKTLGDRHGWQTYPHYLEHRFDARARLAAALVSAVGYGGFVGAQILAGAKLAAVAFQVNMDVAILIMAGVVILYTAFGGLQAVVYTDMVQWLVLLVGLIFVALPLAHQQVGSWNHLLELAPSGHLSFSNVTGYQLVTWMMTIIPIWFVGMTLYQRIYASKDVATARRAWFWAGLLEYPVMAFAGALLGLYARVLFPAVEAELGLPTLIREVLPTGLTGVVLAAYFSAIMSTADSCLLASVGNIINDLYQKWLRPDAPEGRVLALSRWCTIGIGAGATALARLWPQVLDMMLLAYSFMVSGLFVPTLGGLFWRRATSRAAFWSMVSGGGVAVVLSSVSAVTEAVEPILLALPLSALVFLVTTLMDNREASAA